MVKVVFFGAKTDNRIKNIKLELDWDEAKACSL